MQREQYQQFDAEGVQDASSNRHRISHNRRLEHVGIPGPHSGATSQRSLQSIVIVIKLQLKFYLLISSTWLPNKSA